MYYEVKDGHGLPHDPFKAIVSPRPVGWVSTRGAGGDDNLAPYSFFNAVCTTPPIVMFSSEGRKDTLRNVEQTAVFCCNFVGADHLHAMSKTSTPVPSNESEFSLAGLTSVPCTQIDVLRVADAYAALECRVTTISQQHNTDGKPLDCWTVFGEVSAIHIRDDVLKYGLFDLKIARPVSRLGYQDYAIVDEPFTLKRPTRS